MEVVEFLFSIHPDAKVKGARLPDKKHPDPLTGDAGWDVYPIKEFTVQPGESASFATGLTFVAPPGWFPEVVAKTGNARTRRVIPAAVVFDWGYRPDPNDADGAVFSVLNVGTEAQTFGPDKAPVQLILRPLCPAISVEVPHGEIDHNTERGAKRYGMADGEADPFANGRFEGVEKTGAKLVVWDHIK